MTLTGESPGGWPTTCWSCVCSMGIKEVTEHLALSGKRIKPIHQASLGEKFSDEDIRMVRVVMVDEVSIRKRQLKGRRIKDFNRDFTQPPHDNEEVR